MSRLPTPGGPWKRYACAGSASAAVSRRFASICSGTASFRRSDMRLEILGHRPGDLVHRPRAVDGHDALREALRQLGVRLVHAGAEVVALALDPVARRAKPPRR